MGYGKILSKILSQPTVTAAFVIDGETALRIEYEESRIKVTGGFTYENQAVEEGRHADLEVCVFSEGFLSDPDDVTLVMEDSAGQICGHDVPKFAHASKIVREGAVWVSSDFVVYPDVKLVSEPKFVLMAKHVNFLGPEEGVSRATCFNPALSTDRLLRKRFGYAGDSKVVSTVLMLRTH